MTYSNSALFPTLVDTVVHREQLSDLHFDFECLAGNEFLILHYSPLKERSGSHSSFPRVKHGIVVIPLRVQEVDCSNVFDLRLPKAQDWLAQQYPDAVLGGGFQFLIPTLLDPHLGGSAFHNSLGAWLRANGCNGMVYPSARRNFRVASTDECVHDFAGWNFVLYANAPVPDSIDPLQSPFPRWLEGWDLGLQLYSGYNEGRRLWQVLGCEESERNYYAYQHAKFLGKAPPAGPFFDPRMETRHRGFGAGLGVLKKCLAVTARRIAAHFRKISS